MCASTETLDLALGGDPPGYAPTLAFRDYRLDPSEVGPFSTIDGHRVNTPGRLPLGAVRLSRFSPSVDPVPAMLTQDHAFAFPDWYGLTTSFREETLKPAIVVMACAEPMRSAIARWNTLSSYCGSSNAIENVRSRCGDARDASAAVIDESSPPLR